MTKLIPSFYQKSTQKPSLSISESQVPERFREIMKGTLKEYNGNLKVEEVSKIPDTNCIPLHEPHWLKIPNVICVFVDMKNSTALSATSHERSTSRAYQLFTGTAVELFHEFESPYIDIKGDGVFALFNHDQIYRALASAVTFKTFSEEVIIPKIKERTNLEIGTHIGIDQKTVLVSRIGFKRINNRTDRQNEVWAGKPINMASKLASLSNHGELLISDRFYNRITDDHARFSCGCPKNTKSPLWKSVDLSNVSMFDFNLAWRLGSKWCYAHGTEFCNKLLCLDKN
jgi:class 3 adenylate cyclase